MWLEKKGIMHNGKLTRRAGDASIFSERESWDQSELDTSSKPC